MQAHHQLWDHTTGKHRRIDYRKTILLDKFIRPLDKWKYDSKFKEYKLSLETDTRERNNISDVDILNNCNIEIPDNEKKEETINLPFRYLEKYPEMKRAIDEKKDPSKKIEKKKIDTSKIYPIFFLGMDSMIILKTLCEWAIKHNKGNVRKAHAILELIVV